MLKEATEFYDGRRGREEPYFEGTCGTLMIVGDSPDD